MPLPFIAGMLIGAGAITAYNNKEKVIKCLKTGFASQNKRRKFSTKSKIKVRKEVIQVRNTSHPKCVR